MTAVTEAPARSAPVFEIVEPASTHRFSGLLYGPEGSWKSTAACTAPAPILYLNADRRDGIRYARNLRPDTDVREVRPTGLASLHQTVFYVREHPEVQTVVLDTVGRIFDLVLRDLAKDDKHATLPEIGLAQTEIERCVELLIEEDVNVVLVAHDMTVETKGSENEGTLMRELMPMTGTSRPGFSRKLMRLVSVVAYCGVAGDGDQRRGVAQFFNSSDGRRAKDGTGALAGPEGTRDLDLQEWAAAINAFYASGGVVPTSNEED